MKANREKLEKLLPTELRQGDARDAYVNKRNHINGLLSVWDMLMADAIGKDGEEYKKCFIPFDDALEIFYDSFEEVSVKPPFVNTDKDKLLYALVHEQWGLCVYVVTHEDRSQRFIAYQTLLCRFEGLGREAIPAVQPGFVIGGTGTETIYQQTKWRTWLFSIWLSFDIVRFA